MDSITFMYLLSLAVDKKLETRLMDVVTAYSYCSLDIDIYIRVLVGLVEVQNSKRTRNALNLKGHYVVLNRPVGCGTNV